MDVCRSFDVRMSIKHAKYLDDYRRVNIGCKRGSIASGTGMTYNSIKQSFLASAGEFFEREGMMLNRMNRTIYKDGYARGFSVINKTEKKVPVSDLIVYEGVPGKVIDTCGLASHIESEKCIENAAGEFVERQSLIFSYLSKIKGTKINLKGTNQFTYLSDKLANLKFYDISMVDEMYVILCKGVINGKFHIGVGGGSKVEDAINGALKEAYVCGEIYKTVDENYERNEKDFDYLDVFLSLSTEELVEAFSYLDETDEVLDYNDLKEYEFDFEKICMELNDKYGMDPLIIFLKPIRELKGLKIAKVFDVNWFPTLSPLSYTKEMYDYVEEHTKVKLDRKCNFIPFP